MDAGLIPQGSTAPRVYGGEVERDAVEFAVDDDEDVDPRRLRSPTRLLDAATKLLSAGGIEAVTIDAVTKASKVARTTLYRHFSSSTQLLAATFERLRPQVTPPPVTGSFAGPAH